MNIYPFGQAFVDPFWEDLWNSTVSGWNSYNDFAANNRAQMRAFSIDLFGEEATQVIERRGPIIAGAGPTGGLAGVPAIIRGGGGGGLRMAYSGNYVIPNNLRRLYQMEEEALRAVRNNPTAYHLGSYVNHRFGWYRGV